MPNLDAQDDRITCPLCGWQFTGTEGCASCPMGQGCAMVKCPNCRYEFVERSQTVDAVKAIWRGILDLAGRIRGTRAQPGPPPPGDTAAKPT